MNRKFTQINRWMTKKPKKEHTLSKYIIEEEKCLQEAWKEGKEKNLSGDDLFNYVEKRSLELFND